MSIGEDLKGIQTNINYFIVNGRTRINTTYYNIYEKAAKAFKYKTDEKQKKTIKEGREILGSKF